MVDGRVVSCPNLGVRRHLLAEPHLCPPQPEGWPHNGWFRFGWEFVDENDEIITKGTDVGRVGEEGKLSLVVAFFGDL